MDKSEMFKKENEKRYVTTFNNKDKHPQEWIESIDCYTFEKALNMILDDCMNSSTEKLFLDVLKECLENAFGDYPTFKYTEEQVDFLLKVIKEGYDFRWLTGDLIGHDLDKMLVIFKGMKEQKINVKNNIFYNKKEKHLLQKAILDNKHVDALFRPGYWDLTCGVDYTKLMYKLGYDIIEVNKRVFSIYKDSEPLCVVNKNLISLPYVKLIQTLVCDNVNIEDYLKYNLDEVQIQVHMKLSKLCNISVARILNLDREILMKFLDCRVSDLGNLSHKIMLDIEKQYSIITMLNNKLYRK